MPSSDAVGFASLGLAAPLVAAVAALGYEEPTPIQREAIPVLLSGADLLGQAATGTGKTAAFSAAAAATGCCTTRTPSAARQLSALVLVPTRELAVQVAKAVHKYAKGSNLLNVVPVYGGAPMDHQIRALRRGAEVVVGTPGRVLDHLRRQDARRWPASAGPRPRRSRRDARHGLRRRHRRPSSPRRRPRGRRRCLAATFAPRIMSIAGKHLTEEPKSR